MIRPQYLALCFLFLSACATIPAFSTMGFAGGDQFIVTDGFRYRIGRSRHIIQVPAGFVTDFASIPSDLRWLLERQGRYSRAAVLHDYLYWAQPCTRAQADRILWIAMTESGVPRAQRDLIYSALVVGGSSAWNSNARERATGLPRVVPRHLREALAGQFDWSTARAAMRNRGIADPPFPSNASYCAAGNALRVP